MYNQCNFQSLKNLKKNSIPVCIFLLSSLLFWGLRLFYWSHNHEEPFSDIQDYVKIGLSVYQDWDFSYTKPFWLSYKPPVMPLFIALYFLLRGSTTLDLWPFFQTTFVFLSLLWLAYEIKIITKRWSLALLLIFVVALSKGSIFWSLKAATESLTEGFLYLLCAATLATHRKNNFYVILSLICVGAFLLKPQFLLTIALVIILIIYRFYKESIKTQDSYSYLMKACLFLLIGFLLWLPWGVRTYKLYGHSVLTSTQGPYSFFWELGQIEYFDEDGLLKQTHVNEIQDKAPRMFKNDYEAMSYWNKITQQWLKKNTKNYLLLIFNRVQNSIADKQEYLSKLDRNRLYNSGLDQMLISKTQFSVAMGLSGLIIFVILWPPLLPLFLFPFSFWIMGCLFLGYARVLDPCLPLFCFGLIAIIDRICYLFSRLLMKN